VDNNIANPNNNENNNSNLNNNNQEANAIANPNNNNNQAENTNVENIEKSIMIVLVREELIIQEKMMLFITYSNIISDNFEPVFLYSDKVSEMLEIQCSDTQKDVGILTSQFKLINNEYKFNDFEEICRLILKIKNPELLKNI